MGKFKKGYYVKSLSEGIQKGFVLKEDGEDDYLIGVIDPANFPGHSGGADSLSEEDKVRFANKQWWVDAESLKLLSSSGDDMSPAPFSDHYKTAIQPIAVMQANMSINEFIGFLRGNVIKYACRMSHKGEPGKDAAKLRQYAEWLEKVLKGDKIVVKEDKK